MLFEINHCVIACIGSPANTLDGNDQEAPRRALCTALLTKAPCCTGTSKSDTSEPQRNWKEKDKQMLHSDKIARKLH